MRYGEQMMKFLTAFFVTSAFLFGFSEFSTPSKPDLQELVPSKIVDKKKVEPIRVPYTSCIISAEGTVESIEEYMSLCLDKRNWLQISFEYKEETNI